MVFTLAACGSSSDSGKNETKAPETKEASNDTETAAPETKAQTGDPIKIGLLNETSGAYETWGLQELRGFMCGLHYATGGTMEINGRPIEVIVEDTTGDVGVATQKATKLIEDDKVDILAGSNLSSI
ncbi:MAG: ABC transporter substrate-binding protein, partial [Lachnospiraceae bacterium]|nr:ABC transporter substrate-binding protein [Lachnospiraceae bacterium]